MENPARVRGFTLIEMLVVLVLMLVLVALGIPALQDSLHQSKIRGIAQETTVLMRLARIEAIKRSASGVVHMVPSTGAGDPDHVQAFLDLDADGLLGANDTTIGTLEMPSGVTFSATGFNPDPNGGPNMVIFLRDGSVSATGAFNFKDTYDNCLDINVAPQATARIKTHRFTCPS